MEFWNGGLKALILAIEKLSVLEEKDMLNREGIQIAKHALLDIKKRIEYIHSKDFDKALHD